MKKAPKLRFPEFNEPWQSNKLGNLLEFKNGINASKEQYGKGKKFINVLDILNNDYIIFNSIIGKVDIDDETFEKYLVSYGDVLFQRSSETREEVGTANIYLDRENNATFGGFIIRGKKIGVYDPIFMNKLLKTPSARKEITTKSGGSTRYNVGQGTLSGVELLFPKIGEQEKISQLFALIDEKIEKQQVKVEALKIYKNGMIQKIFSQQIRFKADNGVDFSNWEKGILSDILVESLYPVEKPNKSYWRLGLRSHCKGTFHEVVTDPAQVGMDTLYEVKKDMLIVNITFAWEQAIAITNKKDEGKLVSHRFPTYRFNENAYCEFYKYYLLRPILKYQLSNASPGGAGRNRVLNKKQFLQIPTVIPSLEEQKKIAIFLTEVDKKLEKEYEKLDYLNEWKKGLLQQMFV